MGRGDGYDVLDGTEMRILICRKRRRPRFRETESRAPLTRVSYEAPAGSERVVGMRICKKNIAVVGRRHDAVVCEQVMGEGGSSYGAFHTVRRTLVFAMRFTSTVEEGAGGGGGGDQVTHSYFVS